MLDFSLTSQQREVRKQARAFCPERAFKKIRSRP